MNSKRRVNGWWVICLMAGLGAQPLSAAESGDISRAVEVAPPKGWTPDTPLFHDESTTPSRAAATMVTKEEGGHGPNPTRAARRLEVAAGEEAASVRRTRDHKRAERSGALKREPEPNAAAASSHGAERRARATAGQVASLKEARVAKRKVPKAAATATAAARLDARHASLKPAGKAAGKAGARASTETAQQAAKTGKLAAAVRPAAARRGAERSGDGVRDRSASIRRPASAAQPPAITVARSAKAQRAQAASLAPRQAAMQRNKKAAHAGTEQALAGGPSKSRQVASRSAGRTAKRVSPGAESGARAYGPSVKKG